jgi:pyridoxal phosphate enzyme (YggS family)
VIVAAEGLSTDEVAERLGRVRERIAAAGGADRVRILAVSKGFGADAVRAAVGAGLPDVGENYAQELAAKAGELAADGAGPSWHFIGRLQRNKVKLVAPHVAVWQSVDRLPVGEEIARRAHEATVFVQVAVTDEEGKGGCPPAEVPVLVGGLGRLGLDVRGLMAVGATGPAEDARLGFRQLRRLADDLGLPEVSMGMSGDLEVAVEEGSTMVRIGTALFGPRPVRRRM